ncbi:AAA family ATPase [Nitrosomonas sp. Nm166]|uniref:AAA family ATPase n=1 Tax=Nitrosomonas sp. Nm166 TaxID=1881054 RepID=UPI0011604ED5|nr:ATP-binding protein [Nitrosomonas sp. Nm166]
MTTKIWVIDKIKMFPYISQIKVNNCHTSKNFVFPEIELEEKRHIVLTGLNGSGKTTILNSIASHLENRKQANFDPLRKLKATLSNNPSHPHVKQWQNEIENLENVSLKFLNVTNEFLGEDWDSKDYVISFFKAHRRVKFDDVSTVTKEQDFIDFYMKPKNDRVEVTSQKLKQYLVNKKVYEAFDFMESKANNTNQNKIFFDQLENSLKTIFGDKKLFLEFYKEDFEFFVNFEDGRKITLNQLSEGFSAFLSIIIDLIINVDLIRKSNNDFKFDPNGIVLIDEPETHFHLSMQYEILPLISTLFPNIQLIVATHSPAIISSLKNAVVYDLTSKNEVSDWLLGSSFSELMITHFGLDNEFSPIADKIIGDVRNAIIEKNPQKLKDILLVNQKYLTPSLRLEIESQVIDLESKLQE